MLGGVLHLTAEHGRLRDGIRRFDIGIREDWPKILWRIPGEIATNILT